MKVALTRRSASHPAYREIVQAPPDGVEFVSGGSAHSRTAGLLTHVARLGSQLLGLPHIRLAPALAGEEVDLIHACQTLLLTRRRWVVDVEHGSPFVGTDFFRLRRTAARRIIVRILSSDACRAVLPWTETASRALRRTLGPELGLFSKVRVVYPAVRAPDIVRRSSTGHGCRLLFAANAPAWNFVIKGGRELLEAFRRLRDCRKDVTLTIVGDVPKEIATRTAGQPGIQMAGRVDRGELFRLYEASDVYVMPTLSDTFGMVFLEAMAFGLPIVALERPYTREIVRHGQTGLLVPLGPSSVRWCEEDGRFTMSSDDFIRRTVHSPVDNDVVQALVITISSLIDDPALRKRLGDKGREETMTGRFSIPVRNAALGRAYFDAIKS